MLSNYSHLASQEIQNGSTNLFHKYLQDRDVYKPKIPVLRYHSLTFKPGHKVRPKGIFVHHRNKRILNLIHITIKALTDAGSYRNSVQK